MKNYKFKCATNSCNTILNILILNFKILKILEGYKLNQDRTENKVYFSPFIPY